MHLAAESPRFRPHRGRLPLIAADAFVAANALVVGDVHVGARSSLWFGAIVRGDVNRIRIGADTNIQDATVIHCSGIGSDSPTTIGDRVTVGHMALIHGCRLEDGCMIGMRAVVMDDAIVEGGAMVAAGALVTPGKRVPRGELWAGQPARKLRELSDDDLALIEKLARSYVDLSREYLESIDGRVAHRSRARAYRRGAADPAATIAPAPGKPRGPSDA